MAFGLKNLAQRRKGAKSCLVVVNSLCVSASWREAFWGKGPVRLTLSVFGLLVLLFYVDRCQSEEFPQPIKSEAIERLHRLSPKFFSGAQPEGEAAFRELKQLGVKTIISVDGTKPDVEAARKHGLQYVHLPIGYDGISDERLLQLVKAAQSLDGPVFVHCHHGRHRGPAAAAICCRAMEKWDSAQAIAWLHQAQTSPKYAGLFRDVSEFRMPSQVALAKVPADFPETAQLSTTVEAMVAVDGCWERLKEIQKHGFRTPPEHPDVVPDQEALQLAEHFRELTRNDNTKQRGGEYQKQLLAMEVTATRLYKRLETLKQQRSPAVIDDAGMLMQQLEKKCARCHAAFRDNK